MRRVLTVLLLLNAGCVSDRSPFTHASVWQHACILDTSSSPAGYRYLEVSPGHEMIIELNKGTGHGRWTTTHANHHSVYLVMKQLPSPGEYVRFSNADGNLDYMGFNGRRFTVLCTNMPATAVLNVTSVSSRRLRGHITASVYYRAERTDSSTAPDLFVVDEDIEVAVKDALRRTKQSSVPATRGTAAAYAPAAPRVAGR